MLCKYYLQLGTDTVDTSSADCMDVSAMIKNLDSIKVSYKRVDLGGVVRKCGSSIEFTGKAREAIIAHYAENYLQSSGAFAVYVADNNWNYSKAWECPLDFATMQYDANVLTIGCVDNSVAAIIKANKKSKYEFDVADLKDSSDLLYNGVEERYYFTFNIVGTTVQGTEMKSRGNVGNPGNMTRRQYSAYFPSITATAGTTPQGFSLQTQEEYSIIAEASGRMTPANVIDLSKSGFIECTQNGTLHLEIDVPFWFVDPSLLAEFDVQYFIAKAMRGNIQYVTFPSVDVTGVVNPNIKTSISMFAGQQLYFGVLLSTTSSTAHEFDLGMHWNSNDCEGYAIRNGQAVDPVNLHVVKPSVLLGNIIGKMFEDSGKACYSTIEQDNNGILQRTMLLAAESVRQLTEQKIYSSFNDFCNFMEAVFGYAYTVEEDYLMGMELAQIDAGERETLSHINASYLTSDYWIDKNVWGTFGKMLPVNDVISVERTIDTETVFEFADSVNSAQVIYYYPENVFVVHSTLQDIFYTNWRGNNLSNPSSYYNENGQAKEMVGLRIGYPDSEQTYILGVLRNRVIVRCDERHVPEWLDSAENNTLFPQVVFKHRSSIFGTNKIKTLENVNNLSYQLDDSMAYSDIEVGYGQPDYDNENNAKDEFNMTNYYKADCDLSDSTLSLICPYRADCYGIQELMNKKTNSESTESDDKIFLVVVSDTTPIDGMWNLDRSISVDGVESFDTVFNAAIAPNLIIRNNAEFIGAFASALKFTSADGNSGAVIDGEAMSANIVIAQQLFKVGKISIDTDDHFFPESWEGLIEFEYAGKTYTGYLEGIDICFANLGAITYNLIEKCIE